MPDFQVIIADKRTGKSYKLETKSTELIGKRLGDVIDGGIIGLSGYKLRITGGSDKDGFPMRWDVPGAGRKRILIARGPGYRPKEKGIRRRKTVRGKVISEDIRQINMKVEEYGDRPIEELIH